MRQKPITIYVCTLKPNVYETFRIRQRKDCRTGARPREYIADMNLIVPSVLDLQLGYPVSHYADNFIKDHAQGWELIPANN